MCVSNRSADRDGKAFLKSSNPFYKANPMKMYSTPLLFVIGMLAAVALPAGEPALDAHAYIFSGRPDPASWKITGKERFDSIRAGLAKLEKADSRIPSEQHPYFQSLDLVNRGAPDLPDRIDTLPWLVRVQRGDRVEWYKNQIEWIDTLKMTLPDSVSKEDRASLEAYFKWCREACRQDGEQEESAAK
jgi:hypothetical protein